MQTFAWSSVTVNKQLNLLKVSVFEKKFPNRSTYKPVRLTSSNVFAANEDKILMKLLQNEKDYKAKKYVKEFPQQNWSPSVCHLWMTRWRRSLKSALSIVNPAAQWNNYSKCWWAGIKLSLHAGNAPNTHRMSLDMHLRTRRTQWTSAVAWTCLTVCLSLCFVENVVFWALYFKRS